MDDLARRAKEMLLGECGMPLACAACGAWVGYLVPIAWFFPIGLFLGFGMGQVVDALVAAVVQRIRRWSTPDAALFNSLPVLERKAIACMLLSKSANVPMSEVVEAVKALTPPEGSLRGVDAASTEAQQKFFPKIDE